MEDEGIEGMLREIGIVYLEVRGSVDPCLIIVIIASSTDHTCGLLLFRGEICPRDAGAATHVIRITIIPSLLGQVEQRLQCLLHVIGEFVPTVFEVVVVNSLGVSKNFEEILLGRGESCPLCVGVRVVKDSVPGRLVVLELLRGNLLLVRKTLPLPFVVGSETFVDDYVAGAQVVLPGVAVVTELIGGSLLFRGKVPPCG